jgi:hypothetical protein
MWCAATQRYRKWLVSVQEIGSDPFLDPFLINWTRPLPLRDAPTEGVEKLAQLVVVGPVGALKCGPMAGEGVRAVQVYVRAPDTGQFGTFCGGSRMVNLDPTSER